MSEHMKDAMGEITLTMENETRAIIDKVVDWTYRAVCSTMGPNSKLVLINHANTPIITKDGANAARSLNFGEHRHNMIKDLITSAAIRVDEMVGDGTTTTVFMVKQLYDAFSDNTTLLDYIVGEELINQIKRYLADEVIHVTVESEYLKKMLATTTNYKKDITDNVFGIFNQYTSPNVKLEKSRGHFPNDVITVENNILFKGNYATLHIYYGHEATDTVIKDVRLIVVDNAVKGFSETAIVNILNLVAADTTPVLLLAREFDGDAIAQLSNMNKLLAKDGRGYSHTGDPIVPFTFNVAGTLGGNVFRDLIGITGGTVFPSMPEEFFSSNIGTIKQATISKNGLSFDAKDPVIQSRVKPMLAQMIDDFDNMSFAEKISPRGHFLKERINTLSGENVKIVVAGLTEGEISERYFLYEDAVKAVKSSLTLGVIPGIGYGFNRAAERLVEEVIYPLFNKPTKTKRENATEKMAMFLVYALVQQYKYITGEEYVIYSKTHNYIYDVVAQSFNDFNEEYIAGRNLYIDLYTGDETTVPKNVFDNGGAGIHALESAWSVVKNITRTAVISGKPNSRSIGLK